MTDSLRDRIASVLERHVEDQLTNYDAGGRTECGCGHQGDDTYRQHLADAVIAELGPLVRYWDKDFKELHYCRECGGWGPKDN